MAVYKSTHCYPFLNSLDIRVAKVSVDDRYPVQYLKCKVDTSNKDITGYRIRLLDEDNNQIFPREDIIEATQISPLLELQEGEMEELYEINGTNSGINGTYLQIPFFQNKANKKLNSYNAIYYTPAYSVDRIIMDDALVMDSSFEGVSGVTFATDAQNWSFESSGRLKYNWPAKNEVIAEYDGQTVETVHEMYLEEDFVYYADNNVRIDTTAFEYDYKANRIRVDGEILNSGEIIFVATKNGGIIADGGKTGFYKVIKEQSYSSDSGSLTTSTYLEPINSWNSNIRGSQVVVRKGTLFHNTTWQITSDGVVSRILSENGLWEDCLGNKLTGFHINGSMLKWEITLYQGDNSYSKINGAYVADYSDISEQYYDMNLGGGTVLGSNSTRVQIASAQAFVGTSGLPNPDAELPALKTGSIILQGTYMDMALVTGVSSYGIFGGTRVYVQTYDSTYGHVYPISGSLDNTKVNTTNRVQFFKNSNDPEVVLNDKIKWGCAVNIPFHYDIIVNNTKTEVGSESSWYSTEGSSATTRYIEIKMEDLPTSIQRGIQTDDEILLINQTNKYQNGVYRFFEMTVDGVNTRFLQRAAGYKNWSSYIDRIFLCLNYNESLNGDVSTSNIQCLAGAGTYTLWDPNNAMTSAAGVSSNNLLFTKELPILLFENKIKEKRTYDFFYETNDIAEFLSSSIIDDIVVKTGNFVLVQYNVSSTQIEYRVYYYTSGGYVRADSEYEPEYGDFCYFAQGQNYGKRVKKCGYSGVSWELHTATILKNTSNFTYISPFNNVEPDMCIKFRNNNMFKYTGDSADYRSLLKIRGVNTNLFAIYHEKLAVPEVFVSEVSSSEGTPWKYEIRSYFKASDENPFYTYEAPYVILYKNNLEYSDLAVIYKEQEYWVQSNSYQGNDPFWVTDKNAPGVDWQAYYLTKYQDSTVITGRSVYLSGKYIQFEGMSWESYRWTLTNSEGEVIQDTGKKYDKSISVIFYGLSSDEKENYYYATLYVEDDIGNMLTYIIRLTVLQGQPTLFNVPLKATNACDIHAIKLEYQSQGKLYPSFRYNETDYAYNADTVIWDGGISYQSEQITVTNPNGNQDPLIDYSDGSTINSSDKVDYEEVASRGEKYGVNYYTYYSNNNQSNTANDNYSLSLEQQDTDTLNEGEGYFETEVELDDNFCGDILTLQLEAISNSGKFPYTGVNGEKPDQTNYLFIKFKTEDNLELNDKSLVKENRNKLVLELSRYSDTNAANKLINSTLIDDIDLFKTLQTNKKYYLQPAEVNTENYENDRYEYLHFDLKNTSNQTYILFKKKDEDGNFFCGGDILFGNLCLYPKASSADTFSYWTENRPVLGYSACSDENILSKFIDTDIKLQFIENSDRTAGTSGGYQKWPEDDTQFIWKDVTNLDSNNKAITWEEVKADNSNVIKMKALKRHYGMSDYSYHFVCKIKNIYSIYYGLSNNSVSYRKLFSQDSDNNNVETLEILVAGVTMGTIIITQKEN